ncbi:MAG: polymer-forming cytoskeletal protein [Burkholderiaceae bacterium]
MALQSPFFGNAKRDLDHALSPTTSSTATRNTSVPTAVQGTTPYTSSLPSSSTDSPVGGSTGKPGESKLTVGPNIKLKGVEITDCDTLVVEGAVEATMDSRVIQIAECGSFTGSAEIDIAEIRGTFNGTLTVRQKLMIYSTGKVKGKIRYGKVVIEEGGQLSGEIEFGAAANHSKGLSSPGGGVTHMGGFKAAA